TTGQVTAVHGTRRGRIHPDDPNPGIPPSLCGIGGTPRLLPGRSPAPMKILLLSDLHLSVRAMDAPTTDADIVVLAGDLGRPEAAMEWARQFDRPTLFVAGNHEFYGSDLASTYERLREAARGSLVRVLEREEWRIDGV